MSLCIKSFPILKLFNGGRYGKEKDDHLDADFLLSSNPVSVVGAAEKFPTKPIEIVVPLAAGGIDGRACPDRQYFLPTTSINPSSS